MEKPCSAYEPIVVVAGEVAKRLKRPRQQLRCLDSPIIARLPLTSPGLHGVVGLTPISNIVPIAGANTEL
jgi:hypothetical protein